MGRRVFEQEQIARAVDLGPDEHLADRYPSLSEGAHRGWGQPPATEESKTYLAVTRSVRTDRAH
jgi:hypothetical protein